MQNKNRLNLKPSPAWISERVSPFLNRSRNSKVFELSCRWWQTTVKLLCLAWDFHRNIESKTKNFKQVGKPVRHWDGKYVAQSRSLHQQDGSNHWQPNCSNWKDHSNSSQLSSYSPSMSESSHPPKKKNGTNKQRKRQNYQSILVKRKQPCTKSEAPAGLKERRRVPLRRRRRGEGEIEEEEEEGIWNEGFLLGNTRSVVEPTEVDVVEEGKKGE